MTIDNLIYDKLPEILDEDQKSNKIRNIMHSLSKKENKIINKGTNRNPKWELNLDKLR